MRDYIRRFLIAGMMILCVSLLFVGIKQPNLNEYEEQQWSKAERILEKDLSYGP